MEVQPEVQYTTITSVKKDVLHLELESLGLKLFVSKVKTLKLSYSQVLNGIIALKRDQQQYALDFFKSGAQFAMDSFIASASMQDKVLSIKMRVLCFLFIHKFVTVGEFSSQTYLHSECSNTVQALVASQEVQRAIKSEVESSKGIFSSSNSFKSSGGKVLVQVSSLLHWVEQFAQLSYQIPSVSGSEVQTVSLASLQTKLRGHKSRVTAMASSSQFVFSGAKDSQVRVWDINSLALRATLKGHSSPISCLVVAGDVLYSGSGDGTVRSWDTRSLKSIAVSRTVPVAFDYSVRSLAANQSGLVFAGCSDGVVRVLDAATLQARGAMKGHSQWVTSLAVHGKLLFSGSVDCTVKVWDTESFMCVNVLGGHSGFVSSLAVVGGRLFSGSHDGSVRVWDLETFADVYSFHHFAVVRSMAVSHGKLYVGYADDLVSAIDAVELKVLSTVSAGETSFDNCLAVADGKMFVGSAGKTVQVMLL